MAGQERLDGMPDRDVRVVLADPPWDRESGGGESKRGADRHYPLMPPREIVDTIRLECDAWDRLADDAHMWMWATNATLSIVRPSLGVPDAHFVARALGFEPKTMVTWVKCPGGDPSEGPKIGLGQYARGATEHLVFCRRGEFHPTDDKPATWFAADRGEHSRKPDEQYEIVEAASPWDGEYLELFARRERDGWIAWGNEV